MFNRDGSMWIAANNACLKKSLAVETSVRVWGQPTVIVVDVSAVLWTLPWPQQGTVQILINTFKIRVASKLNNSDVHLVLDRYFDYSTKSSARVARASKKTPTRVDKLSEKSPLPSRDVILKCVANKIQINHLICKLAMNDQEFLDEATSHYWLFISGEEAMPTTVYRGTHRTELQLYSTHEEADIRIVKHALWSCETRDTCLCHFRWYRCVCTTLLPLPKAWFLSRSDHGTLEQWMKEFVLISLQPSRGNRMSFLKFGYTHLIMKLHSWEGSMYK